MPSEADMLRLADRYRQEISESKAQKVGKDLERGTKILCTCTAIHMSTGEPALVQFASDGEYAQFNNLNHEHAFGWWKYPLGTFKKDG